MTHIKYLPILILASTLIACGGGGESSPETVQTQEPERLYTGYRNAAPLTSENSFEFLEQVFVGTSTNVLAKASQTLPSQSAFNLFRMQAALSSIALTSTTNQYQARSVNGTENCSYGGHISLTGNLSNSTNTGTLNAEMNNCDQGSGAINGVMTMLVERVSEAEQLQAYTLSFADLSLSYLGQTYYLSGTQSFNSSNGVETTTSNILQITPDNQQILTENLVVTDNTLEHLYTETSDSGIDLSGKIYIGDYGYVDLYTTTLFQEVSTIALPYHGSLDLVGESSTVKITADFDFTSIQLDEDGDGIYELFSELERNYTDWSTTPTFIDTPPPVIKLVQHTFDDAPFVGSSIDFDALFSYDPNGGALDYEWTITAKPDGSAATLEIIGDTAFASLTPDIAGDYTVQLMLTNENGFSSTESITITVINRD